MSKFIPSKDFDTLSLDNEVKTDSSKEKNAFFTSKDFTTISFDSEAKPEKKKKQTKYRPGNPKAALIFGILSWALNIIPYLFPILAIYFSGNSKDPKAIAGRILGIIYCCVTTIAIILIIVMYITSNN